MLTLAGSHTAGHQYARWCILLHFTAIRFWWNSLGMRLGQPQRQVNAGLAVQNPSAHLILPLRSPPAEPKHQGNKTSTPRASATTLLWKILVPRWRLCPEPVWSLPSIEMPVSLELWWRWAQSSRHYACLIVLILTNVQRSEEPVSENNVQKLFNNSTGEVNYQDTLNRLMVQHFLFQGHSLPWT